jgi:hypothetical protein
VTVQFADQEKSSKSHSEKRIPKGLLSFGEGEPQRITSAKGLLGLATFTKWNRLSKRQTFGNKPRQMARAKNPLARQGPSLETKILNCPSGRAPKSSQSPAKSANGTEEHLKSV